MALPDVNSAMLVLLSVSAYEIIRQIVQYFFKKAVAEDHVKKTEHETCRRSSDVAVTKLAQEVGVIKGILLVLAVDKEVPPELLAKLTQSQ